MSEKRRNTRRNFVPEFTNDFLINNKKQKVRVLDVSPGGMRIIMSRYVAPGADVFCRVNIYPDMSPFYVKGKVLRVEKSRGKWESAVKFDMVRVYNFFGTQDIEGLKEAGEAL